jgi:hypothetical protein
MQEYASPTAKTDESAGSEPATGREDHQGTATLSGDPWRYSCPEGHVNYRPCAGPEGIYYCKTCGEHFGTLYDRKTGEPVRDSPGGGTA